MHLRRLLAAALCASALTACSGDPEPIIADPSPSPTVADSPTESATPEPWEEKSEDGAVAFVKHWLAVFNEAENSGDTELLATASTANCESCGNYAELILSYYAAGGSLQSDGWKVITIGDLIERATGFTVPIQVKQTPQTVIETEGAQPEIKDANEITLSAEVVWKRGQWLMNRLDLVQ